MKILIICNGGMSSSILKNKVTDAAKARDIDVAVQAMPNDDLHSQIGLWDVCLVAPQIMYALENVKGVMNIPTATIDFRVYAMADGEKVLNQALQLMEK